MNNSTSKSTFQKIPVNITGSFQSTYIYSKLCMLRNLWYSETALGTNPFNKNVEIPRIMVSKYVNELDKLGFITIKKEKSEKGLYKNIYLINELADEYWIPVANDFINNTDISAVAKGFAIRLACLRRTPKTLKELCTLLDCKYETAKKYLTILESAGILNGLQLNEEYFPNLRKEAYKNQYKAKLNQLESVIDSNPNSLKKMRNQLKWFKENLTPDKFPYKFLCEKLIDLETGVWDRTEIKKEVKHMANITL